ncbi:hypothetical protein PO909_030342 [Leuciscus waleckii]
MVELICAPKISHNEIGYLKFLTQEYVSARSSLFPYESLKAKHHYLLHYADLILHFGPLIRLWTLRFESKHSYFKNCARKLHNFLHLCKTLAERHQMLQSYLACGQLFPPKIQSVSETHVHNAQLYNTKIQTAIREANCVTQSTSEVSGVVYKGTKYTNGLVVVVDNNSCGYIFGKISLILISPTDVHFVVELYESVLLSDLGVHSLQKYDPKYVCVNADSLLDTEQIQQEIKRVLPELDVNKLQDVANHLCFVVGVQKTQDLALVEVTDLQDFLFPIQCRKLLMDFKQRGQVDETPIEITFTPVPPHDSLSEQPSTSYTPSSSDLLSIFQIPWERMPAALLQAASNKEKSPLGPRREFVRNVVAAMRELCPNPNLADCGEVAKQIFSKHSLTFGDFSEEGEQLGKGYSSLQRQLKNRVEHVNSDNVAHRIRQPKKNTAEQELNSCTVKKVRCKVDSYGCINWQPTSMPDGETTESLEMKRNVLLEKFQYGGPHSTELSDVDNLMQETYIYQRQLINSCPPPAISDIEVEWPYLFTKRGLCNHFETLTGIDISSRLSECLIGKSNRIVNYFQKQTLKWNAEVQALLKEIEATPATNNKTAISAILLTMKYFKEKENSLFILVDETSTKMSIETEQTLPTTPRLIMLGDKLLTSSKWMVSIEGKVTHCIEEELDFAAALAALFGCFYVFNIEYQESASATLELIQRFFVRINPEGTKCAAKFGTSRKTGSTVKRKVQNVNPHVHTFLQSLTEFEWKTSN